jgi:hypothetical protein
VVAVECIFTWYWVADLCAHEGIGFILGHALYMKAIHGGKAKNDKIDAHKIAVLLRGGMLPMAYVYPREMRATRDLLRRRCHFMRKRAELLTHTQNTASQYLLPTFDKKLAYKANRTDVAERFADPEVRKSIEIDDATKRLLYAQLWPAESTAAVMSALRGVFQAHGLPIALYTDRAGSAFYTPRAGGKVDLTRPTQLGRALSRLGIEHIPSYSPQARGRSERLNRTLQGRLINELRVAGIATVAAATAYLREHFIADHNAQFARPPADPARAFVALGAANLDLILCHEEERTVGLDNVVVLEGVLLQLAKQPGRRTCAGLRVTVRRHLEGRHSVWRGTQCLGHYDATGQPLDGPRPKNARAHLPQEPRSRRRPYLDIPRTGDRRGPRLPTGPRADRTDHVPKPSGHFTCHQQGGSRCASADTSRLEPDAERALSRLGEGQCSSMGPAYVSRASVTCSKRGANDRANVALAETRGSGRHVEAELEHPVCREVVAGPRNHERFTLEEPFASGYDSHASESGRQAGRMEASRWQRRS